MNEYADAPEVADRHRRYIALVMIAISLLSIANAAQSLVAPDLVRFTEHVQSVWTAAVILGMLPIMVWKVRNRDADLRRLYRSEDGFVAQTLNQAKTSSWAVTFVFLVFLTPFAHRLGDVPGEVFLHLAIAMMTGVFGVVFLVLNRDPEDDDSGRPVDA